MKTDAERREKPGAQLCIMQCSRSRNFLPMQFGIIRRMSNKPHPVHWQGASSPSINTFASCWTNVLMLRLLQLRLLCAARPTTARWLSLCAAPQVSIKSSNNSSLSITGLRSPDNAAAAASQVADIPVAKSTGQPTRRLAKSPSVKLSQRWSAPLNS